ncbi:heavy-metal-associated domain-containing protein [Yeosuana sp. MJ-SS3]|uniref:Heavy-metal-associated domain-containing protein n=1 Tax=Gilvirhabdus luticola TaxID=3079858 RepID=A0ABU3U6H6_9FLAO|nr:heavy-metal-associated domain-containing protein [Yeosuana sp. MJ-SS3]MDU8886007.1 heavy-metal-associated domain-containing protein [Yeosuana sp. MJ-SS3]
MKTTVEIHNLKCIGCANTITKKLLSIDALSNIQVNNQNNTVSFIYDNESTLIETKKILANLGYPVVGDKNVMTTKIKSYISCAIGRTS